MPSRATASETRERWPPDSWPTRDVGGVGEVDLGEHPVDVLRAGPPTTVAK